MIKLLYIDLFCGAGGTTTGVEAARICGRKIAKVIACVNHDANAIASHAANHPSAMHYTEESICRVYQQDIRKGHLGEKPIQDILRVHTDKINTNDKQH